MKFNILTVFVILLSLNIVSVTAQSRYSVPACSSSKIQNLVGDRFKLILPKKAKIKYLHDVDYLRYFLYFGRKKNHIYISGIFGPNASEGKIPKEWLSASAEVFQRTWVFDGFDGADAKGKLGNGNYWRYFGAFGEEITYYNVSLEAANYFDSILDNVCYQKR